MVTTISALSLPGKEQMVVTRVSGSGTYTVFIERAALTPAETTSYDGFKTLIGSNSHISIANSPVAMDIDRGTEDSLVLGISSLDYASMTAEDKAKVDAFISLVQSKKTT